MMVRLSIVLVIEIVRVFCVVRHLALFVNGTSRPYFVAKGLEIVTICIPCAFCRDDLCFPRVRKSHSLTVWPFIDSFSVE